MWLIAELRNELAEHCPLWSALGDPPRGYGGAKPAISEHGADKQVAVLVQHGAHSAACSMVTSRQRSTLYGTPFVSVQADCQPMVPAVCEPLRRSTARALSLFAARLVRLCDRYRSAMPLTDSEPVRSCKLHCMLCVARCMACVACCALHGVCCVLCVARCVLCVARCMLYALLCSEPVRRCACARWAQQAARRAHRPSQPLPLLIPQAQAAERAHAPAWLELGRVHGYSSDRRIGSFNSLVCSAELCRPSVHE